MYTHISEYMKLPQAERQSHLDLSEDCIELGIRESRECRALLAITLKTTIPFGHAAYMCHACNNGKCCNTNHLYWGTPTENVVDAFRSGANKSIWDHTVEKYGLAEAYRRAGRARKGKPCLKTRLPKKIVESRCSDYDAEPKTRGYVGRLSKMWNVSHTQVRRFINTYTS